MHTGSCSSGAKREGVVLRGTLGVEVQLSPGPQDRSKVDCLSDTPVTDRYFPLALRLPYWWPRGWGGEQWGKKMKRSTGLWAADIAKTNQKDLVPRKWLTYWVRRGGLSFYYGGRGACGRSAEVGASACVLAWLLLGRLLLELDHFPGWWLLHIFYISSVLFRWGAIWA